MNSPLTNRRYELLNFINRCGIISLKQLSKVFTSMTRQTLYSARKQLIDLGYIEEITFSTEKLYIITNKGTKECNYYLKGLNFNSVILNHSLIVNDILINEILNNTFEDFNYKTERDIKQSYYVSGTFHKNILDKIPDFIILNGEKQIAFEVELSLKKMQRLERKINDYFNLIIDETYIKVVYVCGNEEVKNHLLKAIDNVYTSKYNEVSRKLDANEDELLTLDLVKDSFKIDVIG